MPTPGKQAGSSDEIRFIIRLRMRMPKAFVPFLTSTRPYQLIAVSPWRFAGRRRCKSPSLCNGGLGFRVVIFMDSSDASPDSPRPQPQPRSSLLDTDVTSNARQPQSRSSHQRPDAARSSWQPQTRNPPARPSSADGLALGVPLLLFLASVAVISRSFSIVGVSIDFIR